jgi:hypothetical protein
MATQYVVNLIALMAALQAQQATLLAQQVAIDNSLDGQSIQIGTQIERLDRIMDKLEARIRRNQPYELRTTTVVN